jgi:putative DNA primase/helicase
VGPWTRAVSRERSRDGAEAYNLAGATSAPRPEVDETQMPSPSNPMAVARRLVAAHQAGDGLTMRWWRGGWMQHHGTAWAEVEDTVVRKAVYAALEHAVYLHETEKTAEWRPWQPNRRKVSDVLDAFTAILHLPETVDSPAWLDRAARVAPADRIVAVENGLLDVHTRVLHPSTPRYFNRVAVPFPYDPNVGEPKRWLEFLRTLWPGDDLH